ncbi:MAG TPA: dienelactone hydrolase family protein [Chloroflexia bacterium]|nr:dienelactone hydrolase family protein [Chloroflexia bacterium]
MHQGSIHQGKGLFAGGAPLRQAHGAMLMVHGRGATAFDILSLSDELENLNFAYIAPQAADNAWYPNGFMSPIPGNEPWLSSALATLEGVLSFIAKYMPYQKIIILGFSQGACLALEFAARNARRYGGIVGLSGGLIGPDGTPRDYPGSFDGTPVFLGCSDVDPHIPKARVLHTEEVFTRMGASVTTRLYPGMGHTTNQDEIAAVKAIMSSASHA